MPVWNIQRRLILAILVLTILGDASSLFARDAREQKRIDYLIDSLGEVKGAVFLRNGSAYDAAAARSHLRQKLQYAADRIQTAEQFIKFVGTESSLSHKPYQIRFADGMVIDTAVYFAGKLREFDEKGQ